MLCKSHALLLVFAMLALVPDDVHVWSALPDLTAATAAIRHGAVIADSPHSFYRCGLGPFFGFVFGTFFAGLALLVAHVVSTMLRNARIRRTTPESVSTLVASGVLLRVRRIHYTAGVLGWGAMMAAFGVYSYGYGFLLAILGSVVASRGGTANAAKAWLDRGASAERRGEVLIVTTVEQRFTIRASAALFRAAERAVIPHAHAKPR